MRRLLGPTIWKFVALSIHNGHAAELNLVRVFTLIKHHGMVQETSTYGLKTASTVTENLITGTLIEHHLLRVTIIASG